MAVPKLHDNLCNPPLFAFSLDHPSFSLHLFDIPNFFKKKKKLKLIKNQPLHSPNNIFPSFLISINIAKEKKKGKKFWIGTLFWILFLFQIFYWYFWILFLYFEICMFLFLWFIYFCFLIDATSDLVFFCLILLVLIRSVRDLSFLLLDLTN